MAVTDAMGGQIAMSSKRDKVSFIIAKQKSNTALPNVCKQKHSA